MRVFVTGGAGYIGSHTVLQLLQTEHDVLVYDNYANSSAESLKRVRRLSNRDFVIHEGDVRDGTGLAQAFDAFRPEAVIHFAGLKAVGESNEKPLDYYAHNVNGSIEVLRAMQRFDCRRIVFSSSATVYGVPDYLPYDEAHPIRPTSPYGRTKAQVEDIIRDWAASWPQASAVLLRYFNPVGAHASGEIGEDPHGIPNNLVPFIAQVAVGRRPHLGVFGDDYDTRDGTGERDYIHVEDLARAHMAALTYAAAHTGCEAVNIGTGRSATVLEMVKAFEAASGRAIPYRVAPRRDGDVARMLASVDKARQLLDWEARLTVDDMCRATWAWQSANPNGYGPADPD